MLIGGQTVTLGKVISDIGLVSIVVLMGLWDQLVKAVLISRPDIVNPVNTTKIQKSLPTFPSVEIKPRPAMDEVSRNCLK